ncbi:hypothetical protein BpHYR1_031702 [Brachionus plicatilis]|uniref:Uncharacterized protein n=1 Tax=Brachionus plicatilis TaxID=10195 RepID=A0A3M7QPM8_BRAPC|nr:hypothetical protein BpHYR1_031702 [Brachionus plicatilis]
MTKYFSNLFNDSREKHKLIKQYGQFCFKFNKNFSKLKKTKTTKPTEFQLSFNLICVFGSDTILENELKKPNSI